MQDQEAYSNIAGNIGHSTGARSCGATDHGAFLQELQSNMYGEQQFPWPFPERPKPPCSMRELIAIALHELPNTTGSCQQVCEYIAGHFPYYRQNSKWRHSLQTYMTDKRYFMKAPKRFSYNEYTMTEDFKKTFNLQTVLDKVVYHMDSI